MKVITAKSGPILRKYAEQFKGNAQVSIFPECGLSPSEQAFYLKECGAGLSLIITFSPYIISDSDNVHVIDLDIETQMGASINKISMMIWRRETIGELANDKLMMLRASIKTANKEQIEAIINQAYELGDSVERTLFISYAIRIMDELDA
jgi:hypothetical protein